MRLAITHRTEYRFDHPVAYALQRLRLEPQEGATQRVLDWSLEMPEAREEVRYIDQFGNATRLVSLARGSEGITVTAAGTVETRDTAGVCGPHRGFAPLWLFQSPTDLTAPGEGLRKLAVEVSADADLARLHALNTLIGERVQFEPGSTGTTTSAEEALAQGRGVCQDHTHIFIAAARLLGFPARYASGYLLLEGVTTQVATHAWAEAHVPGLGWVGFDAANGISPDERYVRLATGRDYRDAMPISGIILGSVAERLEVEITVEQ